MLEQLFAALPCDIGMWRSLVARVVRDDEVAGSNPVTPTSVSKALIGSPMGAFAVPVRMRAQPCASWPQCAVARSRGDASAFETAAEASSPPSQPTRAQCPL